MTRTATRNRRNAVANLAASLVLLALAGGVASAAPNMVVRIDGQTVANNEEILFPDTPVGESRRIVVTMRNESAETLAFSENPPVIVAGGFPEQFTLIQPALETGNVLSPNGSTAFAIDLKPEFRFQGLFTHVYLWTNAGASPFHLIFRGNATGPEMVVLQSGVEISDLGEFAFPETFVGETTEAEFVIENRGGGALELTGDPLVQIFGGLGEFVVEVTAQPAAVVPANGSTTFRLAFTPTEERFYTTRMFINVNQDDQDVNTLFDIDIVGQSVEPVGDDPIEEDPNTPVIEDPIHQDPIEVDPNEPVIEEPVDEDPNDGGIEQPVGSDEDELGNEEPTDSNADDEIGGEAADEGEGLDQGEGSEQDVLDDEIFLPNGGLCGFGMGFASLMGLTSLGGAKLGTRRRRGSKC